MRPPAPVSTVIFLHLHRHTVRCGIGAAVPFAVLDADGVDPGEGVAHRMAQDGYP